MSPAPIPFPVEGLTDGEVLLRPVSEADVPAVTQACQDPDIQRYTQVPSPYVERDAADWARRGAAGLTSGTDLHLVVVRATDAEVVGSTGLHEIDRRLGRGVAGYWVAREARGRGVAQRALRLLCAFAFDELGIERIEVQAEPENAGSRRVAEGVGFTREGVLRSYMPISGARRDMLMYSLLPGELR